MGSVSLWPNNAYRKDVFEEGGVRCEDVIVQLVKCVSTWWKVLQNIFRTGSGHERCDTVPFGK